MLGNSRSNSVSNDIGRFNGACQSIKTLLRYHKKKNTLLQLKILTGMTIMGIGLFLLIFQTFVSKLDGADAPECRMSYMSPAYAKVNGFDHSHTKYASKYSLYLYREQGKDLNPDDNTQFLNGAPILFIPGNAGSYKQVRALAAECANLYVSDYQGKRKNQVWNNNAKNLDFFTADFNEDFTAFHGRTLLDQSEYLNDAIKFILSLYAKNNIPTKSVIVVGHSMGGIVARTMITLPNYANGSINTFLTLAAPHAASPVTFDGDLMKVYSSIDKFWRGGFLNAKHSATKEIDSKIIDLAQPRLKNVSLISITGGLMDTVLPADYTSIKSLVPNENGFTVFTTGIPGVWTPIDHLAIVWCDQLRKVLARTLLEIVDNTSMDKTYPLQERMKIFRRHLLSGFEDYSAKDYESSKGEDINFSIKLKVDNDQISSAMPGERSLILPPSYSPNVFKRGQRTPKMNFFYLPEEKDSSKGKYEFTALSSLPFESIEDFGKSTKPVALLCRNAVRHNHMNAEVESSSIRIVDFTSETTSKGIELECIDVSSNAHSVPRSAISTVSASESSIGGKFSNYNVLQFNSTTLSNFELVVIGESPNFYSLENRQDFIVADLVKSELANIKSDANFWKFLLFGVEINLPAKRPLAVDVSIPSIWSSLVAYNLKVVRSFDQKDDRKPENERFGPLIRQWIPSIFETKWLVGLNNEPEKLISLHSVAPYVPFESSKNSNALHLQVWSDSMSTKNLVTLKLRVDILTSLRLLVMRFRLVIGTLPVAIVALVLGYQFRMYSKAGEFVSFGDGLVYLCTPKALGIICGLLSFLSLISSNEFFQGLFYLLDPIGLASALDSGLVTENISLNPFFLGLEEDMLFVFGPIFFIISLALVCLTYNLVLLISWTLSAVYLGLVFKLMNKRNQFKMSHSTDTVFLQSKRRIIGTIFIIGSIPFYFPYQFAYVVITLVQVTVCIRSVISYKSLEKQQPSSIAVDKLNTMKHEAANFKNFNLSFFMLMLWILPINIPVLIVFIHNFALKWQTPFSSHHNFLAIVPIFIVIEKDVSGKMPVRMMLQSSSLLVPNFITQMILGYMAFYSIVFGVRHAWWLHYLLNFFCTWLVFLNFDIWGTSNNQNNAISGNSYCSGGSTLGRDPERAKSREYLKRSDLSYLNMTGSKIY